MVDTRESLTVVCWAEQSADSRAVMKAVETAERTAGDWVVPSVDL